MATANRAAQRISNLLTDKPSITNCRALYDQLVLMITKTATISAHRDADVHYKRSHHEVC